MFTYQAFQILLFIIPGLIASTIINTLTVRNSISQFNKYIESLILSLVIYVLYSGITGNSKIPINSDPTTLQLSYEWKSLLCILAISIIFGIIMGAIIYNDVFLYIARKSKLTKKTGRNTVWYDVFADENRYVTVECADGTEITGYPKHFSDSIEYPSLYLIDASLITGKGKNRKYTELDSHGILFTPESKITSIIFHNNE